MEREEEEKTGAAAPEDAAGEWRSREVRSEMSDGRSGSAWDRVMARSARLGVELEGGGGISSARLGPGGGGEDLWLDASGFA
jgi:hypothetical protein